MTFRTFARPDFRKIIVALFVALLIFTLIFKYSKYSEDTQPFVMHLFDWFTGHGGEGPIIMNLPLFFVALAVSFTLGYLFSCLLFVTLFKDGLKQFFKLTWPRVGLTFLLLASLFVPLIIWSDAFCMDHGLGEFYCTINPVAYNIPMEFLARNINYNTIGGSSAENIIKWVEPLIFLFQAYFYACVIVYLFRVVRKRTSSTQGYQINSGRY